MVVGVHVCPHADKVSSFVLEPLLGNCFSLVLRTLLEIDHFRLPVASSTLVLRNQAVLEKVSLSPTHPLLVHCFALVSSARSWRPVSRGTVPRHEGFRRPASPGRFLQSRISHARLG